MANNVKMYDLSIDQIVALLMTGGHINTTYVEGAMGSGKSSILKMLSKTLAATHKGVYFDCTTKDLGDIMLPRLKDLDGNDYVRFATNEELGMHFHEQPIVLMLDEFGKANPSVKNALLRLLQEREIGPYRLHEKSIVFATSNLGAEGVGDLLPPHGRNRITVITMRKPSHLEWIEWGINNDIDHSLLAWVREHPQAFHDFTEVKNPDDNEYIFHPKSQRSAFVTPRSLEKASNWLKLRDRLDDQSVTAALIGTVGARAAQDMMAFTKLADQLPTLAQIKADPANATVPTSAAAICMVVYRALGAMDKDLVDPWMDYLDRLDKEAQGMFANGVRSPKYQNQGLVLTNKKFTKWAMANNYMFAADRK
jgi:hypothetical protein